MMNCEELNGAVNKLIQASDGTFETDGSEGRTLQMLSTFLLARYEDQEVTLCEYASLHLPHFIEKAFLPNFLVNEHGEVFKRILTLISTTDYFARWVRTQDGIGLLLVIAERLNSNFPSLPLKGLRTLSDLTFDLDQALSHGLGNLCNLLLNVILNLPPPHSTTFTPIPLTLAKPLASKLKAVKDDLDAYITRLRIPTGSASIKTLEFTRMYVHAVYLFSLGSMVDPLRKPRLEQGQLIAWVSCGGRNKKGACEGGEGDDMMACSRCNTVRYCSKAHQKANWKTHKRICFTPAW